MTESVISEVEKAYERYLELIQVCYKAVIVSANASVEAAEAWVETEKIRIKIINGGKVELTETKQIFTGENET